MIKQINPAAKHAPASARIGFRRISRNFMSGASVLTLAIASCASLSATMAHADPSITWSGDVSPTPTPGTTNWSPAGNVNIRNGGTLTISGGATMGVENQWKGALALGASNGGELSTSSFIVDGAGSAAHVATIGSIGVARNVNVIVRNGGVLTVLRGVAPDASQSEKNFNTIVEGNGSKYILNAMTMLNASSSYDGKSAAGGTYVLNIKDGGIVAGQKFNTISSYSKDSGKIKSIVNIDGMGSILDFTSTTIGESYLNTGGSLDIGASTVNISNGGVLGSGTSPLQVQYGSVINVGSATGASPVAAGTLDVSGIFFLDTEGDHATINFNHTGSTTLAASMTGLGDINQIAGDTVLTGDSPDFTGAVNILGGALYLGDGGTSGSIAGNIVNNGSLVFNRSDAVTSNNSVSGAGNVIKQGAGTLTLTGANTYSGGTQIKAGAISIASANVLGSGAVTLDGGSLLNTAAVTLGQVFNIGQNGGTINNGNSMTLNGALGGTGALNKTGAGELTLNGDGAAFTGPTAVDAGTLTVHGSLGGDVNVASGAALDGDGTIHGNATIAGGGALIGKSGQSLTFTQNLNVANAASTNVALGAYTPFATFDVQGDLTLGGTINVTDAGGFGAGIYTIYQYGGQLHNNGVSIGTLAAGITPSDIALQTNVAHQINIVNSAGGNLGFWDGPTTSPDNQVDGGSGTWTSGGNNWTNYEGSANAPVPQGGFVVFMGHPGTVTVDNAGGPAIQVKGMQFAVDGYTITGDALELVDAAAAPIISVGDGSQAGGQMTATISSNLNGSNGLNKANYGTLVLTADNQYTGTTTISQGTLQLGNGGTHGSVMESIVNNGTLAIDRSDDFSLSNRITGSGGVLKKGTNTLTLTNASNGFKGGLKVEGGSVIAGNNYAFGSGGLDVDAGASVDLGSTQQTMSGLYGAGTVHTNTGSLILNQDADTLFAGQFDHAAGDTNPALLKSGTGALVLTGDNSGNVGILGGTVQIGNGGTTGSINGHIDNNDTLAFNRSDTYIHDGVISGVGVVNQIGTGTTVLTGENVYTGGTNIRQGTLQIGNGGTTGSIEGNVTNNATLAFNRSDNVAFSGSISGMGSVVQTSASILTLEGNNTFTGGLKVAQGTVNAGIADTAFGAGDLMVDKNGKADLNGFNTILASISGEGSVALTDATLTLNGRGGSFDGSIGGNGGLTLDGSHQTLAGTANYSGATTLRNAILQVGANNALSAASSVSLDANSSLDMDGFSATTGSITNAGNIMSSGHAGSVLNVAGNYNSAGGSITLNTVLGGDNSATDMLKVSGNVSGNTVLHINNNGGVGAQTVNGIKVIDVAGQTNGGFTLGGDYYTKDGQQAVVAGAYAYTLRRNSPATPNDGDWYLTNQIYKNGSNGGNGGDTPPNPGPGTRYSAGVPIYEGYAQNMQALNKLPTLQQRIGNRYWTGENGDGGAKGAVVDSYGVWARVEGAHNRFEPETSLSRMKQDINTVMMQAGVDGQFYEDENGKLVAGFTGQYGHAKGDISSFSGDGSITTDAWSLGATATWYGNNGFYVDTQGQVTWFDNDLESSTANIGLANGRKATGYGLSMEAGQRIELDQNWSLTPQAQLAWSAVNADDFNDVWNSRVSLHDGNSLLGRIGIAANYRNDWKGDDGLAVNTTVYGIANLYQEFLSGSSVEVGGVSFDTDNDRTWAGTGVGGSYAWADNKYAVYGEGSINTSLSHFADSYAYKASVGFKAKW